MDDDSMKQWMLGNTTALRSQKVEGLDEYRQIFT